MSDLTDFLLARIAEDEEAARDEQAREERWPIPDAPYCRALTLIDYFTPERVLAECEAKRRIVEMVAEREAALPFGAPEPAWIDAYTPDGWGAIASTLDEVLVRLAQPYASHQDFQEGWRQ